jgi:hypothetical protein
MKYVKILLVILLIVNCVGANAQSRRIPKTNVTATVVGQLSDTLNNTSSLFYWQDRLWTLNDHGDIVFYAIDAETGAIEGIIDTHLPIEDMEEVAQDEDYFYFGDFGNNHPQLRSELYIYRMSKSDLFRGNYVVDTTTFLFSGYDPEAPNDHEALPITDFDCEAMVAAGDSLYLFSKQWTTQQTICYALPKQPGEYTAAACHQFNIGGLVTGAWLHPETCLLVLCGYSLLCQPFVWLFYDYQGHNFFGGENRRLVLGNGVGSQMEAIVSRDGLHYYLTQERFNQLGISNQAALLELDLSEYLRDYLYPDTTSVEGLGALERPMLKAFPNPTRGLLNLEIPKATNDLQDARVVLYATDGRELLQRPVTSERMQLSLSGMPAEQYLVRVVSQRGSTQPLRVVKMCP